MATLLTIPMASLALQTRSSHRSISFSRSEALLGTPLSIASLSVPLSASTPEETPSVYCGRGDKKTAKGKRFKHSFGNARPRNKNKGRGPPRIPVPPSPPKKVPLDDEETMEIEVDDSDIS
ncbi:hypothetical protein HPP92_019871 [Vanilla planifolia]|uniref:30S ribosomal protein S31, chloroplastic n=1 Tax=Vanilla planifolia TaxID=51239 RepID=A0A835Q6K3_VANPL|nr:hypothetical protein HPP92_019871 [Vanilla planifolia]